MERLSTQLAQLESAQLLRRLADAESAYLFKHALTHEAAYESLLYKTRREVHLRVAEAIEADSANVPGALPELARHFYLGGNSEKALDYSRRAGQEAEQYSAYNEAILAQKQLDVAANLNADYLALAGAAQSAHYLAVGWRVHGVILTAQAMWEQARRVFDEAISTLDKLGSCLELGHALYHRGVMFEQFRKTDAARADAERALGIFERCGAVRDANLAAKLLRGI